MIAIDTHLLVRHLTEDDPHQLVLVHKLFRKHDKPGTIFVSTIVLLELSWVLKSCYQWTRGRFCDCIEDILRVPQFAIEQSLAIKQATLRCRKGQDFSDALIGQIAAARGLKTYTLDKTLEDDSSFIVLD